MCVCVIYVDFNCNNVNVALTLVFALMRLTTVSQRSFYTRKVALI